MKTFFCNRTVDKSEMKRLIKWVLLNYGTQKATRFVDHLKTLGFHSATAAGISLGIDDLRIPPVKSVFLKNAEKDILDNDIRYTRGQITAVERLEKALDIWNTTNDTLKNAVIAHFRETDIFNPVYMMAFSGARGNISQVRQLVGMRGLMADQQGQVLDFPIRRNFREGLTVTEYMISCYGARKGLVDTALRTANSGYLTRRLVDVAQGVIIQQFDCDTNEGLEVIPSPQNECANIVGRVLLQPVIDQQTGKYLARKNTEISPALASKLIGLPKVVVRSPLTCRLNSVCQLCYGWDLSKHRLVQLGEAVGVLAAQSIGEPGTQLTMRTFHTGGVFAGEATEKVYSPYSGIISYGGTPRGRKVISRYGEPAFLTVVPVSIKITRLDQGNSVILRFPAFTLLFVYPGQYVMFHQSLAELSRVDNDIAIIESDANLTIGEKELLAPDAGQIYVDNVKFMVPEELSSKKRKINHHESLSTEVLPPWLTSTGGNTPKTQNKVFGYGFIWILSGQLLRNNQSYQGDYFHKGFQPFNFGLESTKINDPNLGQTAENFAYQRGMQDLLRYNGMVRTNQSVPFSSAKAVYNERKNVNDSLDSYVLGRRKQITSFQKHVTSAKLVNSKLVTYFGKSRSCHTRCLSLSVENTTISSRWKKNICLKKGKACFSKVQNSSYIRYSVQTTPTESFAKAQTLTGINSLPHSIVNVNAGYKHWSNVCQMFPDNVVHACYELQQTFWNSFRANVIFPENVKYCANIKRFPQFNYVYTLGVSNTKNVLEYLTPSSWKTNTSQLLTSSESANFVYSAEGEIRLPELAITKSNQHVFKRFGKKCIVQLGDYIRTGDQIFEGIQAPCSGQVIHINETHVIVRRVYPYAMSHGSSLFVNHGDLIQKDLPFGTLVSLESTAGDIVQGLPKVDELLEAREPVEKILSSVHAQLATLFLLYSKTYGLREGCRRSLQEIRRMLVNEVQAVYGSQGVFISDKHIEIIVRQMTTYVLIVDPGDTNLLPGDIVDLRRVEQFEVEIGTTPVQYRPILLGITRASLAAESFIAAASFQETKRVLTRAAVEGRIDWLTGLKENVILGRLIPAGTGLYV